MESSRLRRLEQAATRLNPAFTLSEDWVAKVAALADPEHFIDQAAIVLEAEADASFFEDGHYTRTLQEKATLSHSLGGVLTELLAATFPERVPTSGHSPLFGEFTAESAETVAGEIAQRGFCIWSRALPDAAVDALLAGLRAQSFRNRATKRERTGERLAQERWRPAGVWWLATPRDLAALPAFQALAFDPAILAVAQAAIGALPIHVQTNAWWSFPERVLRPSKRQRRIGRNAQTFHQDQEFIRFLKVFLYLSEVGEENGPHIYVEGSADDYERRLATDKAFASRSDVQILSAFGGERIRAITGPRGQVAFVDTRGYHKGEPVRSGRRILVQLEYASSMYFNPVTAFDADTLTGERLALHRALPRLFQNYRPTPPDLPMPAPGLVARLARAFG